MKKSAALSSCLLVVLLSGAYAQHGRPGRNTIGISLGWQELKFMDDHASPLLYKAGSLPAVGLNYTHKGIENYFKIKLAGGTGKADPERFGARDYLNRWSDKDSFQYQISSMFVHANLEATYLRKLNPNSTGNVGYWLGGTINEQAYYADEVANFPWMLNAAELSPAFMMDYHDNSRHSFSVKIDLAGLALLTRSIFALFPKSNRDKNVIAFLKQGTRLTSVNRYQKVNVEFNYGYYVSNRITLGGTYAFKWLHYSHPRSLKAMDNRFNVNLDYSLNK